MKDQYLTYTDIDFSMDPDFIDWVKKGANANLWENWLSDHAYLRERVETAKELVLNIKIETIDTSSINRSQLWDKISNDIQKPTVVVVPKKSITRRLYIVSAAAASLALLLYFTLFFNNPTKVQTFAAQQVEELLPDGSSVQLNAQSQIAYLEKKWDQDRKVKLDGEAYFKVKKGSSFIVKTPLGSVEVLGTSFNVYARDHYFSVSCTSGKVRVTSNKGDKKIILPGEMVSLTNKGKLSQKSQLKDNAVAWLTGDYVFSNQQLSEVVEVLERQFDVNIKVSKDKLETLYTGSFNTQSLEQSLHTVFWPLKLEYSISGKEITIK